MTRWPWIIAVAAALIALNPLGQNAFYAAFQSGETLSRNIWGPIYLFCAAILFAAALIEWYVRRRWARAKETEN
jgi:Na+-driven multidrug efflux pump